jgi:outer membrane lipoprotein
MAFLLGACASTPPPAQSGPTPAEVASGAAGSERVHWGGRIVQVRNLAQRTLVEVLGLPLDEHGAPLPQGRPQGRFIVEHPGFLEPHEYAPERMLVVRGRLAGFTEGNVGEAPYRFPVVVAEQLELQQEQPAVGSGGVYPRINFGIGGGSRGGSVGIGIGF